MEIDRKNGAVRVSLVLEQIGNYRISKNNVMFSKSFFSKKFSYKCIWPIVAAAAAAAAAATKKYDNQDSTKVKNWQNI